MPPKVKKKFLIKPGKGIIKEITGLSKIKKLPDKPKPKPKKKFKLLNPLRVLVLSVDFEKRKQDSVYLAMRQNLITKGYITRDANLKDKYADIQSKLQIAPGIVRKEQPSKRVMDGWKKFFRENFGNSDDDLINRYVLNEVDIMLMEDDVLIKISKKEMQKRIKRDKINFLCYQKFFKEKGKDIPVGSQVIYIPWEMIVTFAKALLSSKSIHFDRWISRLPDITYNFGPKEFCNEITRISATTGKVRKGYNLSDAEIRQLKETKPKKFYEFDIEDSDTLENK